MKPSSGTIKPIEVLPVLSEQDSEQQQIGEFDDYVYRVANHHYTEKGFRAEQVKRLFQNETSDPAKVFQVLWDRFKKEHNLSMA